MDGLVQQQDKIAAARDLSLFDMILMDMQMPEMDGLEATRQIRASGNRTPIYALTANVMQKHRDLFSQAGSNGLIAKPIDKTYLRSILEKHLVAQQTTPPVQHRTAPNQVIRILAIDDEEAVRSTYEAMLVGGKDLPNTADLDQLISGEPYSVADHLDAYTIQLSDAASGQAGYELFEESLSDGDPFAVVLLDMRMPGGGGTD